jgi:citrate lyase beta subunit
MTPPFDLALFSVDPPTIRKAVAAGVSIIIVDLEWRGKPERQVGFDTEVNRHHPSDVARARRSTSTLVMCRINAWGRHSAREIERVLENGADIVLLPMVSHPRQVESFLVRLAGRAQAGILVETYQAIARARDLARFALDWVYVGLNDLMVERGGGDLFLPVADGTLARVRDAFAGVRFGFGGMTVVGCGRPIPDRLLVSEMVRLECSFGFLRRSFYRDIAGRSWEIEVPRILAHVEGCRRLSRRALVASHRQLGLMVGLSRGRSRREPPRPDALASRSGSDPIQG